HLNLIFGLGLRGVVAPLLYPGTTDRPLACTYVAEVLAPRLRRGDLVVLDRHTAHAAVPLRRTLRARGAHLWFLPPYSPRFAPIESCGSKVKHWIRVAEPRTGAALLDATAMALDAVTPHDIRAWFEHCGLHANSF